ncbi:MAG TPA: efflux RND transporter periplasmic adaptor subunit, partial [Puia sp.]|nr:efflux RND transporter periplasmic adaptor subunit [Puia sp.]
MKKYRAIIVVAVLLLAGIGIWYFFYRKKDNKIYVITEKPQIGYISKSVTATGTIEPVDTVAVGSQVSGTIAKIYTDFNARVTKGQLIAEMDKSLFIAQVDQYKANLELSKATLTYQKSNFDRQTLLFNTGSISKADFETAQDSYLTAKATVASSQAQLDAAQKNLSYASIYSPVNGVVLLRNVSVGQTVAASFNTPTLFIIAKDITKMQVRAAVDEADIGDVTDSQRVIFTVDAYPDITFTGKVNQIRLEPVVSANVVTYTTIVTAPNDNLKLMPGMTANIFIYTKEVDSAMLISSKDLKFKPDPSLADQYKILPHPESAKTKLNAQGAKNSTATGTSKRKAGNLSDSSAKKKTVAFVWVQYGDSLEEKKIHTGLNDDTHVEVLD